MNLGQLKASFSQHRTAWAAGGAGAVAAFALYRHHQVAAAPAGPTDTSSTAAGSTNAADQVAGSGYSSGAYDGYDQLEAQIEAINTALQNGATPTPTQTSPPPPVTTVNPGRNIGHVLSPSWPIITSSRGVVQPSPPGRPPAPNYGYSGGTNL